MQTQKIKNLELEIAECERCLARPDYDLCGECLKKQNLIQKLKDKQNENSERINNI